MVWLLGNLHLNARPLRLSLHGGVPTALLGRVFPAARVHDQSICEGAPVARGTPPSTWPAVIVKPPGLGEMGRAAGSDAEKHWQRATRRGG
jgi:hypothetical protein